MDKKYEVSEKDIKMRGLIIDVNYVAESDRAKKYEAITKNEADSELKIDCMDDATTSSYPTDIQDRITLSTAIRTARAGIYKRIYYIAPSPYYTDKMKFESIDSDKLEDKNAPKSNKEVFETELRHFSDYSQTPYKWAQVDRKLHWFLSQVGPDVEVIHIDTSVEHPENEVYNATKEYFAPLHHDSEAMDKLDRAWATILGYEGYDRENIVWIREQFDEKNMYIWANGGLIPGTTPDKQIVECPVCHQPTYASAASVGFRSYTGEYTPIAVDPKQMTCEHCGASLASVFSGNDQFLPLSRNAMPVPTGEKDEHGDDIFDTLADQRTEFNDNIDPLRVIVRAEVMSDLEIRFNELKKTIPVQKNRIVRKERKPDPNKKFMKLPKPAPYAEKIAFPEDAVKCPLIRADVNKIINTIKYPVVR